MTAERPSLLHDVQNAYVVIVYDRWEDSNTSFVLGPYASLQDAQAAWKAAYEKIGGGYRRYTIEKCRTPAQIPEWEQTA